jgi:hypothetical protein
MQWIIQRRSGEQWKGEIFLQDWDAMRGYRADALRLQDGTARPAVDGFFTDPSVGAAIDALPAKCPQRAEPLLSQVKVSGAARMAAAGGPARGLHRASRPRDDSRGWS